MADSLLISPAMYEYGYGVCCDPRTPEKPDTCWGMDCVYSIVFTIDYVIC